jgi:serine/threonine-protein kinase
LIALTVFGLLVIGLIVFFLRREKANAVNAPIKSVAVLPFKPLVAENRDEALEMGMADTLIARMGGNREIIVRPLSSVRRYGNLEQDPLAAGRELDVEMVLDGSLQRVADKIRVNVRLLKTADGSSLWSDTFDEKFTDIFVVQDAISRKIAESLKTRLGNEALTSPTKGATQNVEAYRFYLQGRYHALKLTPPEIRKGIEFYRSDCRRPALRACLCGNGSGFCCSAEYERRAARRGFPAGESGGNQGSGNRTGFSRSSYCFRRRRILV